MVENILQGTALEISIAVRNGLATGAAHGVEGSIVRKIWGVVICSITNLLNTENIVSRLKFS